MMPFLHLTIENPSRSLIERKDTLMAALEEKVGLLGQQLYDTVHGKLSGGVLNTVTGALLDSVVLQAVAATGMAFETFVEIPEDSPQHLIGLVHEEGGAGYYLILPVVAQALHFIVGGDEVYTRRVNHPPALRRSFMRSSLEELSESIKDSIQETVNAVLGEA